jgi:hypothetical protein
MTIAGGSLARNAYVAEATYGETPANPVFQVFNPTSISIGLEKETFQSETIRSDRQLNDFRHGVRQVSGDIGIEFRDASWDDLLQAVMMGTWSTDVLKAGTTRRSFTIERFFSDIGRYRRGKGCEANAFTLDCPASGIVTGTFSFIGMDDTGSGTAITGSTYTADPNENVMDSLSGSITVGGSAVTCITSIKLTLENGIENLPVVGETTRIRGAAGRSIVTGELTAFYQDDTLLDAFEDETEVAIVFTLTDSVATYTFTLPKVKFTGGKPEVGGEREVSITMPFQAIYSSSDATQLKIERA